MEYMYYTYVLESKSGKRYVGQTNNLERRLFEHNNGLTRYTTKQRTQWKVIYYETFPTRSEAMKREAYFKTGKGRDFVRVAVASA